MNLQNISVNPIISNFFVMSSLKNSMNKTRIKSPEYHHVILLGKQNVQVKKVYFSRKDIQTRLNCFWGVLFISIDRFLLHGQYQKLE